MTDREKLIELLGWKYNCVDRNRCLNEQADHLLANGVIVPPCKVGNKVYYINTFYQKKEDFSPSNIIYFFP